MYMRLQLTRSTTKVLLKKFSKNISDGKTAPNTSSRPTRSCGSCVCLAHWSTPTSVSAFVRPYELFVTVDEFIFLSLDRKAPAHTLLSRAGGWGEGLYFSQLQSTLRLIVMNPNEMQTLRQHTVWDMMAVIHTQGFVHPLSWMNFKKD